MVSQGEDWASTPWIAAKPDGAVVGWYDYGYMAVYSVRSADLTVRDGALAAVNPQCLKEGVDWYLDLHVASNASGLQAMAYTRSKYDVLVCTRRGSEPWSRPVLMSYGDGHCGVHPKLLVDEDDTIHLMWQFGFKNGHMERNAQVIYNHLTPTELAQQPDYVAPPSDFTQPIPANADKRLDEHPADVVRAWLDKKTATGTCPSTLATSTARAACPTAWARWTSTITGPGTRPVWTSPPSPTTTATPTGRPSPSGSCCAPTAA